MSSAEENSRARCLPARYYVALVGTLALYAFDSNYKYFTMIMTHVTSTEASDTQGLIFTNCTVFNTSRDLRIEMREDTVFLLYSTYYLGFLVLRISLSVLTSRFSLARMMGGCLVLANIVTLCLPYIIQTSTVLLFVSRFVQGLLEGALFPINLGLLSAWTTDEDKGRLFTISVIGLYMAPAVAASFAMLIMCYVSWDAALFISGATGILTGVITLMTVYDTPEEHPSLPRSEVELHQRYRSHVLPVDRKHRRVPWRQMLTSLPLWAAFGGYLSRSYVYFILMVALTQYLTDAFSINIADIGLLTTLPHTGLTAMCVLGGLTSDFLLKLGLNVTFTRKLLFTVGHLVEGVCLLGLYLVHDWRIAVTLLTVGISMGGVSDTGYLPLASDMAPTYAVETSNIISTASIGSVAGSLMFSAFCGHSMDISSWQTFFLISGLLSIVSVLFFDMAASAEIQPWAQETSSEEDTTEKTEFDKLLLEPAKSSSCCTNSGPR